MNYMYGEGFANEIEAQEVVRKINGIIGACEADVGDLVRQKLFSRNVSSEMALEQLRNRAMLDQIMRPYTQSSAFGNLTFSDTLGLGRLW